MDKFDLRSTDWRPMERSLLYNGVEGIDMTRSLVRVALEHHIEIGEVYDMDDYNMDSQTSNKDLEWDDQSRKIS